MRTTTDDTAKRYLHRALPTVGVAGLLIAGAAPAVAAPATPSTAAAVLTDSTTDPGKGHEWIPGLDMPASDMPSEAAPTPTPAPPAHDMEVTLDGSTVRVRRELDEPRYPGFKGIMAARKKPVAVLARADLGVDLATVGTAGARTEGARGGGAPGPRELHRRDRRRDGRHPACRLPRRAQACLTCRPPLPVPRSSTR